MNSCIILRLGTQMFLITPDKLICRVVPAAVCFVLIPLMLRQTSISCSRHREMTCTDRRVVCHLLVFIHLAVTWQMWQICYRLIEMMAPLYHTSNSNNISISKKKKNSLHSAILFSMHTLNEIPWIPCTLPHKAYSPCTIQVIAV